MVCLYLFCLDGARFENFTQGISSLALRVDGLTSKGHNFFIKQAMNVVLFTLDYNIQHLQLLSMCQEPIMDGKPSLKAKHLKLSKILT